jgi:hypothetical protein
MPRRRQPTSPTDISLAPGIPVTPSVYTRLNVRRNTDHRSSMQKPRSNVEMRQEKPRDHCLSNIGSKTEVWISLGSPIHEYRDKVFDKHQGCTETNRLSERIFPTLNVGYVNKK